MTRPPGRPRLEPAHRQDGEQLRLPLPLGTRARIRGVLAPGESALAFIRTAIARELTSRGAGTGWPIKRLARDPFEFPPD